jgi:hypothetical protein
MILQMEDGGLAVHLAIKEPLAEARGSEGALAGPSEGAMAGL